MLFLHELHTISGRDEDAFEDAFRTGWMPALAGGDDARLLWYMKLAHGTGRAYQVVTVTGLRDGAAYERLATRVQRGDLRAWAADIDRVRHEVAGKLLLAVDWSPLQDVDLATVPTDAREHDPTLFMEDSAWPYEAKLDSYLEKARTHYAPSLEQESSTFVAHAARGVPGRARRARGGARSCCGSASTHPERLPGLFTTELPARVKGPGTWMHDALEVRDDWESRLLRTASWSPLG